jgi:hypothetical protein
MTNFVAVGGTTTGSGAPAVSAVGVYAREISNQNNLPLWSWSEYTITHVALKPFKLETTLTTGFAKDIQKITFGSINFYVFVQLNAGLAQTTTNTGYDLSEGAGVHVNPWVGHPWTLVAAWMPSQSSIGGKVNNYVLAVGRSWQ